MQDWLNTSSLCIIMIVFIVDISSSRKNTFAPSFLMFVYFYQHYEQHLFGGNHSAFTKFACSDNVTFPVCSSSCHAVINIYNERKTGNTKMAHLIQMRILDVCVLSMSLQCSLNVIFLMFMSCQSLMFCYFYCSI